MKESSVLVFKETLLFSLKNYTVSNPEKIAMYSQHSLSLALCLYFANWLNPKSKSRNSCTVSTAEIAEKCGNKKWSVVDRLLKSVSEVVYKEDGKWVLCDDLEYEIIDKVNDQPKIDKLKEYLDKYNTINNALESFCNESNIYYKKVPVFDTEKQTSKEHILKYYIWSLKNKLVGDFSVDSVKDFSSMVA